MRHDREGTTTRAKSLNRGEGMRSHVHGGDWPLDRCRDSSSVVPEGRQGPWTYAQGGEAASTGAHITRQARSVVHGLGGQKILIHHQTWLFSPPCTDEPTESQREPVAGPSSSLN